MEASWEPLDPSWRLLESPGDGFGALGAFLETSWEVLGRSWRCLGGSPGRHGAVLGALEAMLEPSGSQKAPKMEPKRVPNRAPEATRAENGETLIFDDSTKDFNDLSCLRAPFCRSKCVQNEFQIASSTLQAPGSLLTRILDAIIALQEASWTLLDAS